MVNTEDYTQPWYNRSQACSANHRNSGSGREDSHLLGKIQDLDNGGTGGEYVTDDDGLLWYAPPGFILRLVIPRSPVPGILALVHTTYGHPGVARTTELTRRKYHWISLKGDIRNYVVS